MSSGKALPTSRAGTPSDGILGLDGRGSADEMCDRTVVLTQPDGLPSQRPRPCALLLKRASRSPTEAGTLALLPDYSSSLSPSTTRGRPSKSGKLDEI